MQTLPFALVPTVLVPLYLSMRGVIWAQLRAQRTRQSPPHLALARGAA